MKNLIVALVLFLSGISTAQQGVIDPVTWESNITKISDTEYDVILTGSIDEEWHVFSQFTSEDGSLPSVLSFEQSEGNYELLGTAKESETVKAYNDIFEVEETYFLKKVEFTQRIKILNQDLKQLTINLEYQVCKEVCINKEEQFVINLDGSKATLDNVVLDEKSKTLSNSLLLDLKHKERLLSDSEELTSDGNLWKIFVLGFLGGLVALLTPCVFPMIPLTVSFFTKQSGNKAKGIRNAILYGAFIVIIYV